MGPKEANKGQPLSLHQHSNFSILPLHISILIGVSLSKRSLAGLHCTRVCSYVWTYHLLAFKYFSKIGIHVTSAQLSEGLCQTIVSCCERDQKQRSLKLNAIAGGMAKYFRISLCYEFDGHVRCHRCQNAWWQSFLQVSSVYEWLARLPIHTASSQTNINSDWVSKAFSGLFIIYIMYLYYVDSLIRILGCNNMITL